jgi:hypothetical protein
MTALSPAAKSPLTCYCHTSAIIQESIKCRSTSLHCAVVLFADRYVPDETTADPIIPTTVVLVSADFRMRRYRRHLRCARRTGSTDQHYICSYQTGQLAEIRSRTDERRRTAGACRVANKVHYCHGSDDVIDPGESRGCQRHHDVEPHAINGDRSAMEV